MGNKEIDFMDGISLIKLAINNFLYLLKISLVVSALCIVIVLFLPNKYTATAKLLPSTSQMGNIPNLSLLSSFTGMSFNTSQSYDFLFREIVLSDKILDEIISQKYSINSVEINLYEYFNINHDSTVTNFKLKNNFYLKKKLKEDVIFAFSDKETTMMLLSVTLESPELAADLANAILEQVDKFNIWISQNSSNNKRDFMQRIIKQYKSQIVALEDSLLNFELKNINYQSSLEKKLLHKRINQTLTKKIDLLYELEKEFEMAKMSSQKDTPTLKILDYATVPVKKSGPPRIIIIIVVNLFILFLVYTDLLFREKYNFDLIQNIKNLIPHK